MVLWPKPPTVGMRRPLVELGGRCFPYQLMSSDGFGEPASDVTEDAAAGAALAPIAHEFNQTAN